MVRGEDGRKEGMANKGFQFGVYYLEKRELVRKATGTWSPIPEIRAKGMQKTKPLTAQAKRKGPVATLQPKSCTKRDR